jgi:hypothetical protein
VWKVHKWIKASRKRKQWCRSTPERKKQCEEEDALAKKNKDAVWRDFSKKQKLERAEWMNEKVDQMKQKYQETKEALAQGIKQKYQQKKEALAQAWGNLKEKLTKK